MAPQSQSTMLDSFFGSKSNILCSNGGGLGGVDHGQYHCYQSSMAAIPSMPSMPSIPSCSKENGGDHRNAVRHSKHYKQPQLINSTIPSCTPKYVPQRQNTPPIKKKKNHTKRVTFITQEKIREIPSLSSYTRGEIDSLYLSRDEMNRSHEECWRLVDLMNTGIEYEDHEQFSKRGLIDLKDDSVDRRRKMRDQTYQIVLGVQQFHRDNKRAQATMDVVEVTANLYRKASVQAKEEALEAAWFDAVAVRV
ncbi:unnamed protein product [Pseudo-nitzschia multistriata]|uniref:Uncharacterized protein n=1 Tax=Pseudo-nitzschia multistriata TaxID=183589 RepID=A0A448YVT7_9STRA|nr:unnamed protein product [Pseudo-nitzschia multistriata]